MKSLLIDTSTEYLSLAIAIDEKIVRYQNVNLNREMSKKILPNIEKLLTKAGITLKDIDVFGVGLGPGTFTGLRVGLSTIKAFVFALNKPLIGISSLDIVAQGAKNVDKVCVLQDARRQKVFACVYENVARVRIPISKYMLKPLDEVLDQIEDDVVFIGQAASLYKKDIKSAHKGKVMEDIQYPQARWMLPLVLERYVKKQFDSVDQLTPQYLYAEDCQVRK